MSDMNLPDGTAVDVVIVNYFKAQRLTENVSSLVAMHPHLKLNIIVIDNSVDSQQWSILQELAPLSNARLHQAEQNLGYSAACNLGARLGNAAYVLMLNPDIIWDRDNALEKMTAYLSNHPATGIVGPCQINDDGRIEPTARRFPNLLAQIFRRLPIRNWPGVKHMVTRYEATDFDYQTSGNADWLQSSCILMARDVWEQCGGMDERYFIFMADCELCFQAWKKGYAVTYIADATVQADGKRASAGGLGALVKSPVLRLHLKDAIRYQAVHLFSENPRLIQQHQNV